ncbi:hypothetical protein SUGI_0755540 [Cryptomeria japonica]|nr:hypothetical protein SUGI_0755540 [Cryptomeria japonica]
MALNLLGDPLTAKQGLTHASSTSAFGFVSLASGRMSSMICPSHPKRHFYKIDDYKWQFNKQNLKQRISCVVTKTVVEEKKTVETSLGPRSRRLILLRHAKSSWDDPSLRDHDRPLSKHGRLAAASIAGKLYQLGWLPELILSSDAYRTRQTLQIMQAHIKEFLEAEVHFIPSFYSIAAMDGQTAQHLQQAVCQYSRDDILTIMCMGHNRGWEEAASVFSGVPVELKTTNAAVLEASGKSWEELEELLSLPLVQISGRGDMSLVQEMGLKMIPNIWGGYLLVS